MKLFWKQVNGAFLVSLVPNVSTTSGLNCWQRNIFVWNPYIYLPFRFKLEFYCRWMYIAELQRFLKISEARITPSLYTWCILIVFQSNFWNPQIINFDLISGIQQPNTQEFQMVITSSVEEKSQPSNRMVANLPTESWINNPEQNRYLPTQSHLLRKPTKS